MRNKAEFEEEDQGKALSFVRTLGTIGRISIDGK